MELVEKSRRGWLIGIIAAVLAAAVITIVLFIMLKPAEEPTQQVDAQDWANWAESLYRNAMGDLEAQGVVLSAYPSGFRQPSMSYVDEKPTTGNEKADRIFLESTGELKGKIAIFFGGESLLYVPYSADAKFHLRDEVLDASTYIDNDRYALMPFDAKRYATTPEECDTLIVIVPNLVSGDERVSDKKYTYADTEVIIIDVSSKRVVHIEYLGVCLAEIVTQNPWGSLMKGEAMLYIGSLAVDGVASQRPYTTPYQLGPAKEISDEEWLGGMDREGFLATGEFGEYNTLVINVVERRTPIVSQQKVMIFVVKLFYIEDGEIIASVNFGATTIVSPHPDALLVEFDNGAASLSGDINYQDMSGTITLPGYDPVEFYAVGAAAGACRDCKATGLVGGQTCPQCSGTEQQILYQKLVL